MEYAILPIRVENGLENGYISPFSKITIENKIIQSYTLEKGYIYPKSKIGDALYGN